MPTEFKLPELGEGVSGGAIAKIMVAVGDTIADGQPVLELETEKAILEVPATVSGVIQEIRVQVGQTVKTGDVLFVLDAAAAPASAPAPAPTPPPAAAPTASPNVVPAHPLPILASPSVRQLARELGVRLEDVAGEAGGRVHAEDVRAYANRAGHTAASVETPPPPVPEEDAAAEDRDAWGPVTREPMTVLRRKIAERMSDSWRTIPHVTHFDTADITELEAFRTRYHAQVEEANGKLTVTAILLKLLGAALQKFPKFNATADMDHQTIVLKRYCNIGIAVDTEHGLLVPVVRDVDRKSILELAAEIPQLSWKARQRKLTPAEMQGGTFTLTNLGGIGGNAFTPIINAPEVAILGVSRAKTEAVWRDGHFTPRLMLPLSLSYDHRVIDGAEAARFLRWLCEALEQPYSFLLSVKELGGW